MSWLWSTKSDPKYTNVLGLVAYSKDVETSNLIGYDVYNVESKDPREIAKFVAAFTFKDVPLSDEPIVINGEFENAVVEEFRKYFHNVRVERKEGRTYMHFSS